MRALDPISRILISTIFILSGISKIVNWQQTSDYMHSAGMFLVPVFLAGAILVEIVGGLSILFGVAARWGSLLLIAYLIPTTMIFHSFWSYAEPERTMQLIQFLKNLAIMGGLLHVVGHGAGALSIDESPYHRKMEKLDREVEDQIRIRRAS